jgi:hypothetical protein
MRRCTPFLRDKALFLGMKLFFLYLLLLLPGYLSISIQRSVTKFDASAFRQTVLTQAIFAGKETEIEYASVAFCRGVR